MAALQSGNADNDLAIWWAKFVRAVLSRNDSFPAPVDATDGKMGAKEFDPFEIKNQNWLKNFETILEHEPYVACSSALRLMQSEAARHFGAVPRKLSSNDDSLD